MKDEEKSDPELWNPKSLSFTYYNTLQQYKLTKKTWIFWLKESKKGPLSDSQLIMIENQVGINIAQF